MKVVERIKEPIYQEMELFEKKFTKSMSSKVALLNRITHFIVNRKGKQMRPMFVFLVAKMLGKGKVNERAYRGASVIELIIILLILFLRKRIQIAVEVLAGLVR